MPFDNIGMVWRSPNWGWVFDWLQSGGAGVDETYMSAKFTEEDLRAEQLRDTLCFSVKLEHWPNGPWMSLREGRWEDQDRPGEASRGLPTPPSQEQLSYLAQELGRVAVMCMAISHPYFYVVETKPRLTPKEARRHEGKGIFPDAKRPRFLVVDYTGLQSLRDREERVEGPGHASPVPHHRRGHWRRLAERCAAARAEGKTRSWVRPAIVGELAWGDEKREYKVILDL